jgi:hypothetical protein
MVKISLIFTNKKNYNIIFRGKSQSSLTKNLYENRKINKEYVFLIIIIWTSSRDVEFD